MKTYDELKCLYGTLTLDNLGVTQGQDHAVVHNFYCIGFYHRLETSLIAI